MIRNFRYAKPIQHDGEPPKNLYIVSRESQQTNFPEFTSAHPRQNAPSNYLEMVDIYGFGLLALQLLTGIHFTEYITRKVHLSLEFRTSHIRYLVDINNDYFVKTPDAQ
jgi:hypothetical protein